MNLKEKIRPLFLALRDWYGRRKTMDRNRVAVRRARFDMSPPQITAASGYHERVNRTLHRRPINPWMR
jgi:hypothetical protein